MNLSRLSDRQLRRLVRNADVRFGITLSDSDKKVLRTIEDLIDWLMKQNSVLAVEAFVKDFKKDVVKLENRKLQQDISRELLQIMEEFKKAHRKLDSYLSKIIKMEMN